ncbi:cbb3-type cytochrome oxidase assembly protein CcoS [Dyella telluris]|uniref:Cbb3-type cytochrome oxidase assembly protein CcoS n=1 Tax=Dyella telluris TaxID=2763498 RepID=A0A7G8PZT7_9GAMM|nr:cbb3-type cytochrome oxidase assembly protein CcoS [Dyella telluris]QNK00045.1 cbb3-type cytochrome oxidase assembly protein CcoS [Dyella telluris]
MIILLMLVPLSLMLLALAIGAFVWAVRRGQFDDMDTPALDILHDDERPGVPSAAKTPKSGSDVHAD